MKIQYLFFAAILIPTTTIADPNMALADYQSCVIGAYQRLSDSAAPKRRAANAFDSCRQMRDALIASFPEHDREMVARQLEATSQKFIKMAEKNSR